MSLCLLTFTLSFQCTTKDFESVPCSWCGTAGPDGEVYQCNAYHDAFSAALGGYANNTIWLVFAAFQLGRAVQVRARTDGWTRAAGRHARPRPDGHSRDATRTWTPRWPWPVPVSGPQLTGLGKRLSLRLVKLLGRNIVGLGYAVCVSGAQRRRRRQAHSPPRPAYGRPDRPQPTAGSALRDPAGRTGAGAHCALQHRARIDRHGRRDVVVPHAGRQPGQEPTIPRWRVPDPGGKSRQLDRGGDVSDRSVGQGPHASARPRAKEGPQRRPTATCTMPRGHLASPNRQAWPPTPS